MTLESETVNDGESAEAETQHHFQLVAKAKKIPDVDCRTPAAEAIQLVLRKRLETMCALRDRALAWSDPEGVHDMRVASRRLRSALADFKPCLRRDSLPRGQLKIIADALGAVRDEDVALPALENLETRLEGNIAEGIELIAEEHRERRRKGRAALQKAIRKSAVERFQKEFMSQLATAIQVSGGNSGAKAVRTKQTFRRVGVEVITNRLKELIDGSECIFHPTQMKKLHRMRIRAKRLRYAVELFEQCWTNKAGKIAKEISNLQTSLGGLHDCDVWIEEIGSWLKKSNRSKGSRSQEGPRAAAAEWLMRHFAGERTNHYGDALRRWQYWEAEDFLKNLKKMMRKN